MRPTTFPSFFCKKGHRIYIFKRRILLGIEVQLFIEHQGRYVVGGVVFIELIREFKELFPVMFRGDRMDSNHVNLLLVFLAIVPHLSMGVTKFEYSIFTFLLKMYLCSVLTMKDFCFNLLFVIL